ASALPPATTAPQYQSGNPAAINEWDKKIIKTADITMELGNYKAFNNKLHRSIGGYGAYVAGEEQNENEDRITNTISIKVPVNRFEDVLNLLSSEDAKIITKKITTDDVTGDV